MRLRNPAVELGRVEVLLDGCTAWDVEERDDAEQLQHHTPGKPGDG
jgi:hypothetical protein